MNNSTIRAACMALAGVLFSFGAMAAPWKYETQIDKMTDEQKRMAMLRSTNSLSLPFPYAGKNYGTIYIRQHPQHGQDVIFGVDKGIILCHRKCDVLFRINGDKPVQISFFPASSGSSDLIFATDAKALITKLATAKKLMVQVSMYHAGNQVLEFDADTPLEWVASQSRPAASAQAQAAKKAQSVRARY